MHQNRNPQNQLFQVVDQVPSQVWYSLAIGTILTSLGLQVAGMKNLADFVGKWPPTFLAIGLYHHLLRPGSEDMTGDMMRAGRRVKDMTKETSY